MIQQWKDYHVQLGQVKEEMTEVLKDVVKDEEIYHENAKELVACIETIEEMLFFIDHHCDSKKQIQLYEQIEDDIVVFTGIIRRTISYMQTEGKKDWEVSLKHVMLLLEWIQCAFKTAMKEADLSFYCIQHNLT